jgi:hypothetical protein
MRHRDFIAGLGGAAGWPLLVRAQQQTKPVIGWLDAHLRTAMALGLTVPPALLARADEVIE